MTKQQNLDKFKTFADGKINATKNLKITLGREENIV